MLTADPRLPPSPAVAIVGAAVEGEPAPAPTEASASSPVLGARVVALALAPDGAPELAAFLAEPDLQRALGTWFGPGWRVEPGAAGRRRLTGVLDQEIARLDALLTDQVNAILHHPRFQQLEASWRGVRYLTEQGGHVDSVLIRLLNVSWPELCRDFERNIEADQSQLFDKVYSAEFGMPGGKPYGILLCDYYVQHRRTPDRPTDDVGGLFGLAQVAAAAFAPAVIGAMPALLGLDSFAQLELPIDLSHPFRQAAYQRWNALQDKEDTRFVGVVLPRILMRQPYTEQLRRREPFCYREDARGLKASDYLWGNAIYAFGSVVIRAFRDYGWFADIRGFERGQNAGGLVTDLPTACFATDREGIGLRPVVEVPVCDHHERVLNGLGLIPITSVPSSPFAVFYSNQSLHRPAVVENRLAMMNARLSVMLQYMLCVSRFAHYIKVMARDAVGKLTTPEACAELIRNWISNYVLTNDDVDTDQRAQYPLRDFQVQVREAPNRPGIYLCTVHLQPQFQLDSVLTSFRLTTELTSVRVT